MCVVVVWFFCLTVLVVVRFPFAFRTLFSDVQFSLIFFALSLFPSSFVVYTRSFSLIQQQNKHPKQMCNVEKKEHTICMHDRCHFKCHVFCNIPMFLVTIIIFSTLYEMLFMIWFTAAICTVLLSIHLSLRSVGYYSCVRLAVHWLAYWMKSENKSACITINWYAIAN